MLLTTLVNKDHKIKSNFLNKITLVSTKDTDNMPIEVEENTYQAFLKLQAFLKEKKIIIGILSGYRSEEEQQDIYNDYLKQYGLEYTEEIVAPVGYSEHHTGMAIDLGLFLKDHYLKDNNESMENISIYKEIEKYLADFGFILRYPKGKEEITKYPYEPWHIRYVGNFIAPIIKKNNWTLEEYLTNFSGIIPVNKEKNMTSFDVVDEIRNLFGIKKVGHTGTLDPLAEGVLLVVIGQATKIVQFLSSCEKEYLATVKLGIKTDTLDITGKIISEKEIPKNINIKEGLEHFHKKYLQEVPLYSAVKVNGQKLYEYARKAKEVTLPKKEVTIKEISLLEETKDTFTFKSLVSKGCYIRSLINDICCYLNTYGTMLSLTRTKQGNIDIKNTYKLQDIKNNNYKLLNITEVLPYKTITVNDILKKQITNGCLITNIWNIKDKVIFLDEQKNILGIYKSEDKLLKAERIFNQNTL